MPRADKIITFMYRLLKSEGLGLLETAGPVQALLCFYLYTVPLRVFNGIALPLPLHRTIEIILILILYGSPTVRTESALLQYLSWKKFKEKRCSIIWRMILKSMYENHRSILDPGGLEESQNSGLRKKYKF